ncbi:hypothetical protein ACFE04_031735 [Oxalis oulophora]
MLTVLVVENGAMSQIAKQSIAVIENIMSFHVLLDYYDNVKLAHFLNHNLTLPTLFEFKGLAIGQQGYMKIDHLASGSIVFAPAVPGPSSNANLVKEVVTEAYNISILQISNLVIPSGVIGGNFSSSDTTPPTSSLPPPPPSANSTISSPAPAQSPTSTPTLAHSPSSTNTNTFNITEILSAFPQYATINYYLSQTHIATEINKRRMITVLVADNDAMAQISNHPVQIMEKILGVNVILDYLDNVKLAHFQSKTLTLSTLFQGSGLATGQQGFMNISNSDGGNVVFASAFPGSSSNGNLVKEVVAIVDTISVLQVSNVVIPYGVIEGTSNSSIATPPTSSQSPSPPTLPSTPAQSPEQLSTQPPTTSPTNAFDVTEILSSFPQFSSFNYYLTQTHVANMINNRRRITVLVVDNGAISQIVGQSIQIKEKILSLHVVLDYLDNVKLDHFRNINVTLKTLFQETGLATAQQGSLNISHLGSGSVVFASAVPGSNSNANLVKEVVTQTYISILQVSNLVIPPGVMGGNSNSSIALPPSLSSSEESSRNPTNSPTSSKNSTSTNDPKAPQKSPDQGASNHTQSEGAHVPTDSGETPSDQSDGSRAPTAGQGSQSTGSIADVPAPTPGRSSAPAMFRINVSLGIVVFLTWTVALTI